MQKSNIKLLEKSLIGLSVRTSNAKEMNPGTAKIEKNIQHYIQDKLSEKILNRIAPGVTYSVYSEYEDSINREYTYFFGEEVKSSAGIPAGFSSFVIPMQNYKKFTVGPGKMPDICIGAWKKIWLMDAGTLGGERSFIADFEIYDQRSADPANSVFDIYIGIK